MIRTIKVCVSTALLLLALYPAKAGIATPKKEAHEEEAKIFDWIPVIEAIIYVESGGDDNAEGWGSAVGALQITPILVREVNLILERRGQEGCYTLADRYDRAKSIEMFHLIQSYFNPNNDVEQAIRAWNGGMGYSRKGTQRYYDKVMARMAHNEASARAVRRDMLDIVKTNIHYDNRNYYSSRRSTDSMLGC